MALPCWTLWLAVNLQVGVDGPVCTHDKQCEVTVFAGCCPGCCPREPHAALSSEIRKQERRCAAVDCTMARCEDVSCASVPPAQGYQAVCRAGQCVAVPPPPQCSHDNECTLAYPPAPVAAPCHASPCGCCPGTTATAVTVQSLLAPSPPERAAPVKPQPPPSRKWVEKPGPEAPACSPCPGPAPARAACVLRRCVVVPAP